MISVILTAVAGFVFDTRLGKIVVGSLLGVGLFFGWLFVHDKKVEARTEQKIVEKSVDQGKKNNAKNADVRRRAEQPGAFERLLNDIMVCRDCR
jgi:hypothetical protein